MSEQPIRKRAQRAILRNALMRWESATVLAGSVLATYLVALFDVSLPLGLPSVSILAAGAVGYGALVVSSLRDDGSNADIVKGILDDDFNEKFDIGRIQHARLKDYMHQAFEYRTTIQRQVNQLEPGGAFRDQLEGVVDQFNEWIEEIYDLAQRLDGYMKRRPYLNQQKKEGEERITKLNNRAQRTHDFDVLAEIETSINSTQKQIDTINALENTMKRAQLRLENTLTAMGTIYPQTLLLDAKDIDSSRYQRLQQDIKDEVDELADVLHAMDDVYSDSL